MKSEIVTVNLGEDIQKYQLITGFKWEDLIFESPSFNKKVIDAMARLFSINIIPHDPSSYGFLVFYNINGSILDLERNTDIGYIFNDQVLLNYYFNKANKENKVLIKDDNIVFEDEKLQKIFNNLLKNNLVSFTKGNLDKITFFPISSRMGYLSEMKSENVSVNSHFFLMEQSDVDSPYDELGTPHSLAIKNSKVIFPPLNCRECLLVDYNGNVVIKNILIEDLKVKIEDFIFENNINSKFYSRPEHRTTPKCKGSAIVVVEDKIVAIKSFGEVIVPMAGFVIQSDEQISINDLHVIYIGETNNYKFGVQVGPAMVINNKQVTHLCCPFYKGDGTPFPPTVYPLCFYKGRASRIGLGVYKGSPILIWAEGAGKLGYIKGEESCGASLLEFSEFCISYGIDNLVNLDGGGSSQLIFRGKKYLKIADRKNDVVTEAERPIPSALII